MSGLYMVLGSSRPPSCWLRPSLSIIYSARGFSSGKFKGELRGIGFLLTCVDAVVRKVLEEPLTAHILKELLSPALVDERVGEVG